MTGYHTEDIIKKVVTPTDHVEKNGNIIKKVTFEFIYPDTIVPPVTDEEAPANVEETTASDVEESIASSTENNNNRINEENPSL